MKIWDSVRRKFVNSAFDSFKVSDVVSFQFELFYLSNFKFSFMMILNRGMSISEFITDMIWFWNCFAHVMLKCYYQFWPILPILANRWLEAITITFKCKFFVAPLLHITMLGSQTHTIPYITPLAHLPVSSNHCFIWVNPVTCICDGTSHKKC